MPPLVGRCVTSTTIGAMEFAHLTAKATWEPPVATIAFIRRRGISIPTVPRSGHAHDVVTKAASIGHSDSSKPASPETIVIQAARRLEHDRREEDGLDVRQRTVKIVNCAQSAGFVARSYGLALNPGSELNQWERVATGHRVMISNAVIRRLKEFQTTFPCHATLTSSNGLHALGFRSDRLCSLPATSSGYDTN